MFLHCSSKGHQENQAEKAVLSWFRPFKKNDAERIGSDDGKAEDGLKWVNVQFQKDDSNQLSPWGSNTNTIESATRRE